MALVGARARRLVIGALLGLALLAVFFRGLDWSGLVKAFQDSDPVLLAGVVVMAVLTYLIRAWRWGFLLAPLARVPLLRLFSITNVGFAAGLVIPRAGEVVRPYLVARHHGLKTSAAFASIILERLFDLITVLALFAAYLYLLPLPAAQKEAPGRALQTAGALAAAGAVGALVLLLWLTYRRESALALADRLFARLPARIGGALGRALHSFTLGLGVLRASPGHLLAIGAQSVRALARDRARHPPQQPRLFRGPAVPQHVLHARVPDGRRRRADPGHGGRLPCLLQDRAHSTSRSRATRRRRRPPPRRRRWPAMR